MGSLGPFPRIECNSGDEDFPTSPLGQNCPLAGRWPEAGLSRQGWYSLFVKAMESNTGRDCRMSILLCPVSLCIAEYRWPAQYVEGVAVIDPATLSL